MIQVSSVSPHSERPSNDEKIDEEVARLARFTRRAESTRQGESTRPQKPWLRLEFLRPSHRHTALSATLLLTAFALLSRVIGLIRDKYIAYTFGAGVNTDAYNVAFQLPDLINYLLIGGAASISFVTILSRYREAGKDDEGDLALSVILNTMLLVLGGAIAITELFVPLYSRFWFQANPVEAALCTTMTRILLPGQLFFFAGGVLAAVALVRKQFAYQAVSPLVYTVGIIFGGIFFHRSLGISSLAVGALAGAFAGPFLVNGYAAYKARIRYRPILDFHNEGLIAWFKMSLPLMLGVTVVFLDSYILSWFAKHTQGDISRLMYAKRLFTAPMAIVGQAAGAASFPFFASLFSSGMFADYASAVNRAVSRILCASFLLSSAMFALVAGPVGGAIDLCAGILCRRRDPRAHDRRHRRNGGFAAVLLAAAHAVWRHRPGLGIEPGDPGPDGDAGGAGPSPLPDPTLRPRPKGDRPRGVRGVRLTGRPAPGNPAGTPAPLLPRRHCGADRRRWPVGRTVSAHAAADRSDVCR